MNGDNFLPKCLSAQKGFEPEPKISDFDLVADIGSGGYGKVNLYRHKATKYEYAIKLIDKTKFENKLQKEMFAREVEIMYRINHPNIVKLYSHFEDETYCYLVMEYIKNGNLYTHVQSLPNKILDDQTVAKLVADLASALFYLHNMNPSIIHRDIKPENCLIGDNGQLKLGDFGGSNYYFENKARFTTCGTRPYHSPEMILKKGYDTRVDIWAIGVLIFELVCGYPPFQSNQYSMEDNIIHLRINWPNKISGVAKNLIMKILKIDPNARISLKEIVNHQFIASYVPKAEDKFFLPTAVKCSPFIISKNSPFEDFDDTSTRMTSLNNVSMFVTNRSNTSSGGDDYRDLYEKLKATYEKLSKSYEDLQFQKNENDSKNQREIKYLKQSQNSLRIDFDKKVQSNLEQTRTIAILNEEIKHLNDKNELLSQQLAKEEKENVMASENSKLKIEALQKELSIYKEKSNDSFYGENKHLPTMSEGNFFANKNRIGGGKDYFEEQNLYNFYKNEKKKLKELNDKYLKRIDELTEKITKLEKNLEAKEAKSDANLIKVINEKEIIIEQKDKIIAKLNKTIENIYIFSEGIKKGLLKRENEF